MEVRSAPPAPTPPPPPLSAEKQEDGREPRRCPQTVSENSGSSPLGASQSCELVVGSAPVRGSRAGQPEMSRINGPRPVWHGRRPLLRTGVGERLTVSPTWSSLEWTKSTSWGRPSGPIRETSAALPPAGAAGWRRCGSGAAVAPAPRQPHGRLGDAEVSGRRLTVLVAVVIVGTLGVSGSAGSALPPAPPDPTCSPGPADCNRVAHGADGHRHLGVASARRRSDQRVHDVQNHDRHRRSARLLHVVEQRRRAYDLCQRPA